MECEKSLIEAKKQFVALEQFKGIPTTQSVLEPRNDLWILIDKAVNTASFLNIFIPLSLIFIEQRLNEYERLATIKQMVSSLRIVALA